jgi:hypothetical protein
VCSLISVADCSQISFLSLIFIVIVPSIVSIHADLNWDVGRFSTSQHLVTSRDSQIREQIQYFKTEHVSYVILCSQVAIDHFSWSIVTMDFRQGWMPSFHCGLYENCREPSDSMIVVFHNKNDKGKASDSFRWELSGYDFTIESDLGRVRSPRWKSKPNDANRSDPKTDQQRFS